MRDFFSSILRYPLRALPDSFHSEALAAVVNHLLRGQRLGNRLRELEGRAICIEIRDASACLNIRVHEGRLKPARAGLAQVTIRGDVRDFMDLVTRAEDPDTLFFHQRLCIEGDTEAGLLVKNFLDALHYDWEAHFRAVLPPPLIDASLRGWQWLREMKR